METEELIKKLENIEYPEIEVAGHKRRLKAALLSSGIFRKQTAGNSLRVNTSGIELSLTRRVLIPAGILIIVALALFWRAGLFQQNQSAITASTAPITSSNGGQPNLAIIEPMDNATVTSRVISVQGTTEPGAVVSVNDQITVADENGNFSVDLGLDTGINVINIAASDSSGGQTTATIVTNLAEGV